MTASDDNSVAIRAITRADLPAVAQLLNDIFRHQHGVFDQDVVTDFPLVFIEPNFGNCRVIEVDGQIVSHSAIFPCEQVVNNRRYKTALIILVATLEEHRRRGYADQIMRDLQDTMIDEGYQLGILWTRVAPFYEQLGWETVVPKGWLIEDLLSHDLSGLRSSTGIAVRYSEGRHLDGVIGIHDGESVRITRSRDEYAALMQLPKVESWVLERDGAVAAYICLGQARNKHGIIESGGAAKDVAALTANVVSENEYAGPLKMMIYHTQSELADLLRAADIPLVPIQCSKGPGTEMILVTPGTNFPAEDRERLFVWGLDTT